MLEFAAKIDWEDNDISWTAGAPEHVSAVERLQALLEASDSGAGASEASFPMWDENHFAAGRLSRVDRLAFWKDVILPRHPRKEFIMENLQGMRPSRYFQHFKGTFMGKSYDCASPPPRIFSNHWPPGLTSTGQKPEEWAFEKIQNDITTGAIRCLGRVGEVPPPHVVLPLGIEMSKPRYLSHDYDLQTEFSVLDLLQTHAI